MTRYVCLDLETTTEDPTAESPCADTDRIVQYSLRDLVLEGDRIVPGPSHLTGLVRPDVMLNPRCTEVHGITQEQLGGAPTLHEVADELQEAVKDAVIVSYNGRAYDTVVLDAELRRAGRPGMDLETVREIDLLAAWKALEPRTLAGAVARWTGVAMDVERAHDAGFDTEMTGWLLQAMAGRASDLAWRLAPDVEVNGDPAGPDPVLRLAALEALTRPADEVDRARRFKRNENGTIIFAFGKNLDKPIDRHPDYLEWMLGQGFPRDTLDVARGCLAWLGEYAAHDEGAVHPGPMDAKEWP